MHVENRWVCGVYELKKILYGNKNNRVLAKWCNFYEQASL